MQNQNSSRYQNRTRKGSNSLIAKVHLSKFKRLVNKLVQNQITQQKRNINQSN